MSLYNPSYIAGITLYLEDPTLNSTAVGYLLTDHNRDPIQISYDTQALSQRMVQGQLRRFITSNKRKIVTDWKNIPSAGGFNFTADGNLGGAFMKSFYEQNVYYPVWIKVTYSTENWFVANNAAYGAVTSAQIYSGSSISQTTNPTFNPTYANALASNVSSFKISNAQLNVVGGPGQNPGVSTIVFTTNVNHNFSVGNTVFVNGIDQIFNGNWLISSKGSNTFTTNVNNNANFNINSYSLYPYNVGGTNYTVGIFYIDNNDFVSASEDDIYLITGTQNSYSVNNNTNINNTYWQVVGGIANSNSNGTIGSTVFTAIKSTGPTYISNGGNWDTTYSDTAQGYNGAGIIVNKIGIFNKTLNSTIPSVVINSGHSEIFKTYMTNFTYNVNKRYSLTDFVDVNIEFTEI